MHQLDLGIQGHSAFPLHLLWKTMGIHHYADWWHPTGFTKGAGTRGVPRWWPRPRWCPRPRWPAHGRLGHPSAAMGKPQIHRDSSLDGKKVLLGVGCKDLWILHDWFVIGLLAAFSKASGLCIIYDDQMMFSFHFKSLWAMHDCVMDVLLLYFQSLWALHVCLHIYTDIL